jgi:O-antigen ligase
MLAVFLVLVFLTGGASRINVQSLLLLRPLSILFCALGLLTLSRSHLIERKGLFVGYCSIILLCILHLIPLPPAIWQLLQGREIVVEVDRLAGLGDVWRPLTMTPMNGWHALASLVTPLAVLLLGAQLNRDDLYRLLPVVISLGALSGFLGMLQIIGDPQGALYLYDTTNNGSAVGLFANRNHAAVLLACLFPMLAVYASTSSGTADRQRMRKFAAIALGLVLVPLVLVTGSRSGMFMAALALVSSALLYKAPVEGLTVRRGDARFKLGAGHIIATGAIVGLIFLTIVFSRAEALDRLLERSAAEDGRADFWNVGIALIWKYFPFGSGIGSFVEAYQIDEPIEHLMSSYVNHAHNDWLELLLTGGLPAALILFFTMALFLFRTVSYWKRKDQNRRATKFAKLASVLIGILAMASVTDYPLRTPIIMSLFAVFCLWFTTPALSDKANGSDEEAGIS